MERAWGQPARGCPRRVHDQAMNSAVVDIGPRLAVILVLLAAAAAMVARIGQLELSAAPGASPAQGRRRRGVGWQVVTAAARAVAQLGAVSLVIAVVLRSLGLTAVFVLVMLSTAVVTAARRMTRDHSGLWAAAAIVAGVGPVLALLLGSGLIPLQGVAVVPVAGILIGGAMTATSLAGRRVLDELHGRWGEYEAALSLGFRARDAALLVCRPTAAQALVPALDQTRTVGLVTLPGAFVGVLLGGASPVEAGATQVLVLIALLAVEATAVVVTLQLIARGRIRRPPASPPA